MFAKWFHERIPGDFPQESKGGLNFSSRGTIMNGCKYQVISPIILAVGCFGREPMNGVYPQSPHFWGSDVVEVSKGTS